MAESTSAAVIDILSQVLEVDAAELAPGTELRPRGWDSMSSLEGLTRLENHFGGKFDLRAFAAVRTPEDIVTLLSGTHGASPHRS